MANYDKSYLVDTMTKKEAKSKKVLPDSKILLVGDNIGGGGTGGAIVGEGEPTKKTKADLGQTYLDKESGEYYVLNSIDGEDYLWSKVDTETFLENTKYGEVKYYSSWEETAGIQWGNNVTLVKVDMERYKQWLADNPGAMSEWESTVNFDYRNEGNDSFWQVWSMTGQIIILADEIYETTGLDLQLEDPSMPWAYCSIEETIDIDKESEIKTTNILGKVQFESLSFENAHGHATLGIDYANVVSDAIIEVKLEGDLITYIPNYFLKKCINLTKLETPDSLGRPGLSLENVKAIGDDFLYGCYNLQPNYISDYYGRAFFLTLFDCTIGDNFMARLFSEDNETYFNCDYICIQGGGSKNIGNYFLGVNPLCTGEIHVYNVSSLGTHFCAEVGASYIEISLTTDCTEIPEQFCARCQNLTRIQLDGTNVQEIGNSFLANSNNFNQSLSFPSVEKIGSQFLVGCTRFNSLLNLPMVRKIESDFLTNCSAFNQELKLLSLASVRHNFMYGCTSFAQPIVFPSLLSSDNYFMARCNNFVGPLTLEANFSFLNFSGVNYSLTVGSSSYPAYANGVTIAGKGRNAILSLGNMAAQYDWRKLVDGGGGGGSGTTYTFADTNDGWRADGSDGSVFQHTDKTPTIAQATGQSTTSVMSQKAITDIIGDLETALQTINNGGNS